MQQHYAGLDLASRIERLARVTMMVYWLRGWGRARDHVLRWMAMGVGPATVSRAEQWCAVARGLQA